MRPKNLIYGFFLMTLVTLTAPASARAQEAAFVGMQVQGISQKVAAAIGIDKPEGVLVRDVALGGPADKSGIHRGDMIVSFAGSDVDTFEKLVTKVRELKAGDSVPITVIREGKAVKLTMKTVKWTPAWQVKKGIFASLPTIGLTLTALTPKVRDRFGIRWGSTGVVITLIDPEKATNLDLQRGEIIHQVNQKPIWDPNDLVKMYIKAKGEGRKSLLLLVEGIGGFRFSILKVK
ncbi:MAG: PDZ domain-containing protein [Rhodospirillaceae bacterium]|jgi:serine protease Do|nr:PDZ domain-containing protein [Rhodospirillaceae bacterium]MBT5245295.1 PDZ domain-containing protein [Rhodospirillaceae bacterium]MBT5563037.1 PDZ domain-containing protein [Rhodospirillaceae bacterium]MBT6241061.1 PDZ domain-containing protein [Rhodospirillaceae bacterium]MBT7138476.1 PDZ domain-containing protein [Rhodospirillaceae bacterium]